MVAHVTGKDIAGSVEISIRDVELAVGVDADHDGKVTWGELRTAEPQVAHYIKEHLAFVAQSSRLRSDFPAASSQ